MYLALALYSVGQALVIPNWVAGPANLIAFDPPHASCPRGGEDDVRRVWRRKRGLLGANEASYSWRLVDNQAPANRRMHLTKPDLAGRSSHVARGFAGDARSLGCQESPGRANSHWESDGCPITKRDRLVHPGTGEYSCAGARWQVAERDKARRAGSRRTIPYRRQPVPPLHADRVTAQPWPRTSSIKENKNC